jgi:Glycosyltransferase family 87
VNPKRVTIPKKSKILLKGKLSTSEKIILGLWVLLPIVNWSIDFFKDRYNNFKIFKSMFWHVVEQKNLYGGHPLEYFDYFHYGPVFSLIIAPFAVLPDIIGLPMWGIFNVLILYYAFSQLNLKPKLKIWLMLLSTLELANAVWSHQFNACVTTMIILAYTSVEKEKDFQAPFWILLGALTKVYGIVGMTFFLFSKNKIKFVAGCAVWFVVLFVLPMALSSPQYIVQMYIAWYSDLIAKNASQFSSPFLDQSIMGMVRKIGGLGNTLNLALIVSGLVLLILPLFRIQQYRFRQFQLLVLASLLMFVVIFSTSAEHPTFIICVTGLALWLVLQQKILTIRNSVIIFFVVMLTGLAPTHVFSKSVAEFVLLYSLKVLPCFIAWLLLSIDLLTLDFSSDNDAQLFVKTIPTES